MSRRDAVALAVATAAICVPFLDKAFHVDDTLVLRVARNVLADPLDPYAGRMDWFGWVAPVWEVTTNPPLWSYLLAPVLALCGDSEVALHAVSVPFVALFGAATLWLARRFTASGWWPALFVLGSAGLVVSLNAMRDVPAAALGTAGLACFVSGADADRRGRLALGALLLGLALLTKYAAVVLLPVAALYVVLRGRPMRMLWLLGSLALFGAWCANELAVYGRVHVLSLLGRSYGPGSAWLDNAVGLPVVVGSLVTLLPALVVRFARREWPALGEACVAALLVVALTQLHVGGAADVEYLFWSVCGAALLALCLGAALRHGLAWHRTRDPAAADSLFLVAWLCAPLVGSVLFPPFQAVRHLVPALPPLVLLAFRALGDPARWQAPARAGLAVLLALQLGLTATVALADAEYANAYRALAERARAEWVQPGRRVWFVGHWGWMHYARRAGLVQLHAEGPFPEPGDLLVWPRHVDVGVPVHERRDAIVGRLVPVEEILVPGRVPLRTMSPYGAGFHMLQARRPGALPSLPYRWLPEAPLERVEIWAAPRPVPRPP